VTRLVVHAGAHGTRWAASWRQLVSWRQPLEEAGVRLHPADEAETWLAETRAVADGTTSAAVLEAVESAVRDDADIVLLSSERLEDPLREPVQVANLEAFAAQLGVPLTVVVVLRDQLGYLNHLYRVRISQLQMARDFPSFVADPNPAARLSYASAYRHLLDSPDVTFTAVRYSTLRRGAEAKPLLAALGVPAATLAELPDVDVPDTSPGPMLVAGYRLLFKRLWRLGMINALPRHRLNAAARQLAAHAAESAWDIQPFWGWDPQSRAAAITEFGPDNDAFAEQVWQQPWGDDWEDGEYADLDLPANDPRHVADLLDAVEGIVSGLQASRGRTAAE
jgi:hypothetical protein